MKTRKTSKKLREPRIRTILRSMIEALDNNDDVSYWSCFELLLVDHLKAINEAARILREAEK